MNVIRWRAGAMPRAAARDAAGRDADGAAAPLFDTLVRISAEGGLGPALAEGFHVSADGRVCTLRLRADVSFQEGGALTAETVGRALARADALARRGGAATLCPDWGWRALDRHTLELRCAPPWTLAPALLAGPSFALGPLAREHTGRPRDSDRAMAEA